MTNACPTPKYVADAHLLKRHRLQNRVLRAIGNLDRSTSVHDFHVAFRIPYVYDYMTTLCRTQAEVILSHLNTIVPGIGQGDAMHMMYKRLKHGGGQAYGRSADQLSFGVVTLVKA
jgi:hypothetical protein